MQPVAPANLSRCHEMIGNLYPHARTPAELEHCRLTAGQVASFHERGFVGPVRLLGGRQVQVLREGLEKMLEPDYPRAGELLGRPEVGTGERRGVIYFQGAWNVEEAFHDLVFAPLLTVPLCQLLGTASVRFFHDQIFYKPPRHGGVVAWHQDYSYWTRTVPPGHITCFLALDDATLENGCLHLVPGSHRWNLLPKVKLTGSATEDMDSIQSVLTAEQLAQFKPAPMQLQAGEVSFHHCFTLHGSYANTSDRPRRSVVLNYMRPDTVSDANMPIMPGAGVIPRGRLVEGDLFPIAGRLG